MKITKVDVILAKTSDPNWRPVLCRVYTDAGIYGDGEAAVGYANAAPGAFSLIGEYAPLLIGADPFNIEVLWDKLYRGTFWGLNGGPITYSAISALDIALWDLKGKALGLPIHALLGGKQRDRIPCYASQLQFGWPELFTRDTMEIPRSVEDYRANARKAMEENYRAVKYDFLTFGADNKGIPRDKREKVLSPEILDLAEARMAAVRDEVGPAVGIIVENHGKNDAVGAVQLANRLEPYGVMYFEEPNTPNPHTTAYISRNTGVLLAGGERVYSRWQYIPYFHDGSLQVIQPDIGNCGGLTEAKKICDMACAYDVSVQPHVCASPLSTTAALHLEAVIPNLAIHEHHTRNRRLSQQNITRWNPQPQDGFLPVPDEPGLGNEILDETFETALNRLTIDDRSRAVGILPKDVEERKGGAAK